MKRLVEPSPLELVLSELRDFRDEFREERASVGARLSVLEKDVSGAKLLGKAAFGLAAVIGGIFTWSVDIASKIAAIIFR